MKITHLSSPISSQYGGGEKFLDDFTTGIEAEHEFIGSSKAVNDLFTFKGYKATLTLGLFEPVSARNLFLIPISILTGLFQFVHFYKVFKNSDWIISPTSHCETFFVIPWIKLFLRKPVLFMVHAPKVPRLFSIPPLNWLLSKCWGSSPVVFVSQSQKELWNSKGCISSNQIVIYNGFKTYKIVESCGGQIPLVKKKVQQGFLATYCPWGGSEADGVFEGDTQTIAENNKKILKIGFLARLHKEKGCDVLINALELIKSDDKIEVVIAGDGPEKQNLIALFEAKTLPGNIKVKFVGFQSDTKSFYESIDLLVFPSRRESFGLVICEAMERGVSVLSSNIPSSREVKKVINLNSESELTFEMDNYQELAAKIEYFIANKAAYLNLEYKKNLHNIIKEKFTLETMIGEYQKILSSSLPHSISTK
jgi:glycosyltransferase involved in cell wall biosynthesis